MPASRSLPLLLALLATAASCGSSEQDPPADEGAATPRVVDEGPDEEPGEEDDDGAGEGGGALARLGAGVTVNEPGKAPGYVMFAPLRSRTAYIIDHEGNVLHTWENDLSPLSIYLQDDGTLLRAGRVVDNPVFNRGGRSGKIQRLGKKSEILWEFTLCDDKHSLHHDYEPLPNGNILAIAWEWVSYEDAVALGRHPDHTRESGWWPGKVIEIEPQAEGGGKIVWEWRSRDHLIQDEFPDRPNYGDPAQHPERIDVNCDLEPTGMTDEQLAALEEQRRLLEQIGYLGDGNEEDEVEAPAPAGQPKRARKHRTDDWLHLNGIDYHPEADLIVLSTPELAEVWIIDHSTTTEEARGSTGGRWGKGGDLLYRWGNPRNYGAGTYADQQLFFQHMPEWVPPGMPGAGNLTIFNNGMGRPEGKFSSIDELALPFDMETGFSLEKGKAFAPAKPTWQYADPGGFYSFFISGAHRLPNGNTFICSGKWGRLFEVTPTGEIVWEFWNPHGGELERVFNNGGKDLTLAQSCFRATKLSPDHEGLRALGITKP